MPHGRINKTTIGNLVFQTNVKHEQNGKFCNIGCAFINSNCVLINS